MSVIQAMQVGSLELRKTDEGWQYLSEGVENEPDRWCDATDVLGPFGGSGVNDLLDELWTARVQAAQSARKVCQNCQYWLAHRGGICDFIDTIQGERVAKTTGCEIIATAHDDSGLCAELKTAPNYSCPNFASQMPASPVGL